MSASDLSRQLRLVLEGSPDALSLLELFELADTFVLECSTLSDSEHLLSRLEDELQAICDGVLDHSVSQTETFLCVLFHLRPVLPASSLISTWFDLLLRPALRDPRLPEPAVNYAKELIITALDPVPRSSEDEPANPEKEKKREKVGEFRRRLLDLYLLDAYNESSGEEVLEWAELDDRQRESKTCWKANLEDVIVRAGLQRPQDLLTALYHCFASPSCRLQLLVLLDAYVSQPNFPAQGAAVFALHPIMQSILNCLILDNSSTVCTLGLTLLTKLLPIFAVNACEDLKRLLPQLYIVLARVICWKDRDEFVLADPSLGTDLGQNADVLIEPVVDDTKDDSSFYRQNTLPIRPDLEWERLDSMFAGTASSAPLPHQYFSFLYYLFPCNTLRFLRSPLEYINSSDFDSPFTVSWEEALDEDKIRSKSEPLLRSFILHPLVIWRDAAGELARADFWTHYDIPQIVAECTMLSVRHAALGLRERGRDMELIGNHAKTPQETTSTPAPPLSSSAESSVSSVMSHLPTTRTSSKPRVSLQDMIATSVALKSGLDIEIADFSSAWGTSLFQQHQPGTRSPSREASVETSSTNVSETVVARAPEGGDVQQHVLHAIARLQRAVLLLRSDLNFELWMSRESVRHIGRLFQERVVSKTAEMERQGLHNRLREYKAEVFRLQKELKDHKEQASSMRHQYADWNRKLQEKLREFKNEKSAWQAEAAAMRAADQEMKATFTAQGKLLADATNRVFQLETKIKENAHKVDRLHDYEKQIDQLIKMQRLWEVDVQKLNDQAEYLQVFTSKYKKMEFRLETYEKTQAEMDEVARNQRQQISTLESRLSLAQKQLNAARRMSTAVDPSAYHAERAKLAEANTKLREENEELRDNVEEMTAMIELLRAEVSELRGIASEVRSPILPSSHLS